MAEGVECISRMRRLRWLKESNPMAEGVESDGWRSRMLWLEEKNAMAEGDECCGRRRLKQTKTSGTLSQHRAHCISFDSYIKPQLCTSSWSSQNVVYLLIPTSNHNSAPTADTSGTLYIFWFLHQTTTVITSQNQTYGLYIFWFLHQTTTMSLPESSVSSCISFDSYIKPQRNHHVSIMLLGCISFDSYIKPQLKFIKLFLNASCISFDSYIKPQLDEFYRCVY